MQPVLSQAGYDAVHPPPIPSGATLTSVSVGLGAVAILQAIVPCTLVLGSAAHALPRAIPSLKAMGPLASVNLPSFGLDSQAVPLALGPVAFVGVATGPRVYAHHLEAVVPGA